MANTHEDLVTRKLSGVYLTKQITVPWSTIEQYARIAKDYLENYRDTVVDENEIVNRLFLSGEFDKLLDLYMDTNIDRLVKYAYKLSVEKVLETLFIAEIEEAKARKEKIEAREKQLTQIKVPIEHLDQIIKLLKEHGYTL